MFVVDVVGVFWLFFFFWGGEVGLFCLFVFLKKILITCIAIWSSVQKSDPQMISWCANTVKAGSEVAHTLRKLAIQEDK